MWNRICCPEFNQRVCRYIPVVDSGDRRDIVADNNRGHVVYL
jgi:hypothetical protein